ncbi:uncharacterized protein LOC110830615 [Zootermopsis nevadensis]|uniref:uncharacterized protein LOC110830615 n=1 Tax=Zootermopsis nevadensis TaxID=136037 RepID=UPI000B8E8C07|nr:uncharacterized protein LOC110830615 [Zootermopsis nevadensis]
MENRRILQRNVPQCRKQHNCFCGDIQCSNLHQSRATGCLYISTILCCSLLTTYDGSVECPQQRHSIACKVRVPALSICNCLYKHIRSVRACVPRYRLLYLGI